MVTENPGLTCHVKSKRARESKEHVRCHASDAGRQASCSSSVEGQVDKPDGWRLGMLVELTKISRTRRLGKDCRLSRNGRCGRPNSHTPVWKRLICRSIQITST